MVWLAGELCVFAYGIMTFSEPHAEVFAAMHGSTFPGGVGASAPLSIESAAVCILSFWGHSLLTDAGIAVCLSYIHARNVYSSIPGRRCKDVCAPLE